MAEGGIRMRILLFAVTLFIIIHFIRIDLVEGTIPTRTTPIIEEPSCDEETFLIPVTSIEGDTIEALFALYPDPTISFIDRLTLFYEVNPHLKLQGIVPNDKILLPLSNLEEDGCIK